MKIFECKCGSKEIFIKENGNNKGLYCAECGKWIQWLGKDDLRLAQRQIDQSIINPIPRNLDELKEHDKLTRSNAIDEFVNAMEKLNKKRKGIGIDMIDVFEVAEQLKEQK